MNSDQRALVLSEIKSQIRSSISVKEKLLADEKLIGQIYQLALNLMAGWKQK